MHSRCFWIHSGRSNPHSTKNVENERNLKRKKKKRRNEGKKKKKRRKTLRKRPFSTKNDSKASRMHRFFPHFPPFSSTSASKFEFLICAGSILLFEFKFPRYINLNVRPLKMWVTYYKFVSRANLILNYIQYILPVHMEAQEIQTLKPTYLRKGKNGEKCLSISWSAYSNWH